MEQKHNRTQSSVKFMCMGECNHVHNWEVKILDNKTMVLIRDGIELYTQPLPLPDCKTHLPLRLELQDQSELRAQEYHQAKVILAKESKLAEKPRPRFKIWELFHGKA